VVIEKKKFVTILFRNIFNCKSINKTKNKKLKFLYILLLFCFYFLIKIISAYKYILIIIFRQSVIFEANYQSIEKFNLKIIITKLLKFEIASN